MTAGTWLAIALAAAALLVALLSLRRPVAGRHAMTMELSLTLLRYDEGLGLLAAHTRRAHRWWEDVDPAELHLIDRALSMWDLAAWYVATGRVERRAVLEVFRWDIVDLWERAYPYVLHRRVDQPTLWPSLTDLYLDAYDTSAGAVPPRPEPRPQPEQRSVSPIAVEEAAVAVAQVADDALTAHEGQDPPAPPAPVDPAPIELVEPAPVAPVDLEPVAPVEAVQVAPVDPQPVPHEPVHAADVGWGAQPFHVPVEERWAEALRAAGSSAFTEEWGSSQADPPRPAVRQVVRPASRQVVRPPADLEIEQVIDLTEVTSACRATVLG